MRYLVIIPIHQHENGKKGAGLPGQLIAGENLLDFTELRQVLSTYDGDLMDPLWLPQERPVPM